MGSKKGHSNEIIERKLSDERFKNIHQLHKKPNPINYAAIKQTSTGSQSISENRNSILLAIH